MSIFVAFYKNNRNLVDNSIIEMYGRSHWLYFTNHKPLSHINILKKELEDAIENQKIFQELSKNIKKEKDKKLDEYEQEAMKSNDVWEAIGRKLNALYYFGLGMETVVDDIASEYFHDYYNIDSC